MIYQDQLIDLILLLFYFFFNALCRDNPDALRKQAG